MHSFHIEVDPAVWAAFFGKRQQLASVIGGGTKALSHLVHHDPVPILAPLAPPRSLTLFFFFLVVFTFIFFSSTHEHKPFHTRLGEVKEI